MAGYSWRTAKIEKRRGKWRGGGECGGEGRDREVGRELKIAGGIG